MKTQRLLVALMTMLACACCSGQDTCFNCHRVMEGMSLRFTNDIHYAKSISCDTCHGGDAAETNQNISMSASRGFKVRVTHQAIPDFCGKCHSDTNYMADYDAKLPVNQLAQYKTSVHGKLLAAGRKRVAECVDCHSIHDIRDVKDPLSTVSPQRVSKTCAKCHADTAQAFASSPHGRRFANQRQPGCTVCHSAHGTQPATTAMLTGSTSVCLKCHRPGSQEARLAEQMATILTGLEAAGTNSVDALQSARVAVHRVNLAAVIRAAGTNAPPVRSNGRSNDD